MVDVRTNQDKQFTVTYTDDVAVDASTITPAAVTVTNGTKTLPVSVVSKSPSTGNAKTIETVFSADTSGILGKAFEVKLNGNAVSDEAGAFAAGETAQSGIDFYDSIEMQMQDSKTRLHGSVASINSVWFFPDDQNSKNSSTATTSYIDVTFNTAAARSVGVKYYDPVKGISFYDNTPVILDLTEVATLSELETLEIDGTPNDLSGFDFSNLPNLKTLSASYMPTVTFTDAQLSVLTNLEKLSIAGNQSSLSGAAIANAPNLFKVNFNNSPNVRLLDDTFTGHSFTSVDLSGADCPITDAALAAMSNAGFLNLQNCGGTFTGPGLETLTGATWLSISFSKITGFDAITLAALSNLQSFSLNNMDGTIPAATDFSVMTNLTFLGIGGNNLDKAYLDTLLSTLDANCPALTKVEVVGNTGSTSIDKSAGSGWEKLTTRGVTILT